MLDLKIDEITQIQLRAIDFNIQELLKSKEKDKIKLTYGYCFNFLLSNNLFEEIECDMTRLRYRQLINNNFYYPVEEISIKSGKESLIYKVDDSFVQFKLFYDFSFQKDFIRITRLTSSILDITEYDSLFIELNNDFITEINKLNKAIKEHNDYLIKYVNDRINILIN